MSKNPRKRNAPPFKMTVERKLKRAEQRYFDLIQTKLLSLAVLTNIDELLKMIKDLLPNSYDVGRGGCHIWIHRKFGFSRTKRLAIIKEEPLRIKPMSHMEEVIAGLMSDKYSIHKEYFLFRKAVVKLLTSFCEGLESGELNVLATQLSHPHDKRLALFKDIIPCIPNKYESTLDHFYQDFPKWRGVNSPVMFLTLMDRLLFGMNANTTCFTRARLNSVERLPEPRVNYARLAE